MYQPKIIVQVRDDECALCRLFQNFFLPFLEFFFDISFAVFRKYTASSSHFDCIENRIYREELKESLGMNFFSPFQPESVQIM